MLGSVGDGDRIVTAVEGLDLGPLGERLRGRGAWLVGGVARDIVVGETPGGDVDIAIEEDVEGLVADLADSRTHERFGTATVSLPGGAHADVARTRSETYERPGALPRVEPAAIGEDLSRRDFTVNAIAVGLDAPHEVLDPFGGRADLATATLRVLHPESFADDPTRAVRASRYCSRLRLRPDVETLGLLRATDLSTISADRLDSELRRLAVEDSAAAGFDLLGDWGLVDLDTERIGLIASIAEAADPDAAAARADAIMLVVEGGPDLDRSRSLASVNPTCPSEGVRLAAGIGEPGLIVAAAAGADWVRDDLPGWQRVRLEINGDDLIGAGIEPGPAIGAALSETLARRLDGELAPGRESELEVALEIARTSI